MTGVVAKETSDLVNSLRGNHLSSLYGVIEVSKYAVEDR